jgi:hypothetical protein
MRPSVGRVVHYVSYGTPGGKYASECRAALVTEVGTVFAPLPPIPDDGMPVTVTLTSEPIPVVGLAVHNPTGLFFHSIAEGGCRQDEDGHAGGTWHWPERVEES